MNQNEALGLPRGSVRAILALLIVLSVMAVLVFSSVTGKAIDGKGELLLLVGGVTAAYGLSKQSGQTNTALSDVANLASNYAQTASQASTALNHNQRISAAYEEELAKQRAVIADLRVTLNKTIPGEGSAKLTGDEQPSGTAAGFAGAFEASFGGPLIASGSPDRLTDKPAFPVQTS